MPINGEVALRKEKLKEVINRTSDLIRNLKDYADPELYTLVQRKPVIDKIQELLNYLQKIVDELKELDK